MIPLRLWPEEHCSCKNIDSSRGMKKNSITVNVQNISWAKCRLEMQGFACPCHYNRRDMLYLVSDSREASEMSHCAEVS